MTDDAQNFAKAEMLIRKPVEEVFEAIVNPDITSKFWFTGSSGRLEAYSLIWLLTGFRGEKYNR